MPPLEGIVVSGESAHLKRHGRMWRVTRWSLGVALACAAIVGLGIVVLAAALSPPALTPPPQRDLVVSDVTIVNPGVSRTAHQTIIVRRGRIAEIRPTRSDDPPPICANCFAIPGLIDAHVHTPPAVAIGNQRLFGLLYLAYGVTSVRDLGQSDASIAAWAQRLNDGEEIGPHVYRCGPVLDGRDPGWPSALSITDAERGRNVVRRLAREGVDCIKVYNHVDAKTFDAIAAAAAQERLPLIGHVPHPVGLRGVSNFEAQHLTGFPYLFSRKPAWDFDITAHDLAAMNDSDVEEALRLARAQNVSLTPTMANHSLRLVASDANRFPAPPGVRRLPDIWLRIWPTLAPHPVGEEAIQEQLAARCKLAETVAKARARGIDVLAGTDVLMPFVVPGEALLLEIEELARAFEDNEAALAAATLVNGRHVDQGRIGVVAAGARADILLLAEDPVRDLQALRRWRVLIAAGRRYDRPELDAQARAYDRHFHSSFYRNTMGAIASVAQGGYQSNLRR
jgi:2-phospho-L-lactate guanylyltransferase (CobY/MobA/RfbA family)